MTPRAAAFLAAACAGLALTASAPAADWPQWRGPDRTGISTEKGLLRQWPKEGPKLLFKASGLGGGYATVSVVGQRLYTMGSKGDESTGRGGKSGAPESVICLDAKDGSEVWSTVIGKAAGGYPAPRCTPTVEAGHVYALSSDGVLACLTASRGEVVWKKSLRSDLGGSSGGWAYAESPLIDGDRVVVTPGGDKSTIVALNKKDGKELFRALVEGLTPKAGKKGGKKGRGYSTAGYSSAVTAEIAGEKTYVQFLSGGVVGVSASTGKLLWHYDAPANSTANASTPLVLKDAVFAASGYGNGGGRADIVKTAEGLEAKEKYFLSQMQSHHGGMVLVNGMIYGANEGSLLCIDFDSGKVVKSTRGAGKGSIVYVDGMIYHRGEDGTVCLIDADPKSLAEKGKFKQPERSKDRAWAHPVVVNGRLYLRDWDNLFVYDVKGE
jgi:outer membrane protein assembly factor BamB